MAFDIQHETRVHQASWQGFVRLTTISTVGIIVLLGLMAATLL
jgi:hypothetical protein